jgi:hypothetical protein
VQQARCWPSVSPLSQRDYQPPSEFAMYEAALTRRQMNDSEWQELLLSRPNLAVALTARTRSLRAIGHSDRCANGGAPTDCRPCGAGQHH